jgi:hypothetical protein
MPSLCSTATVVTALRSPSEPSALTRYFGATNSDSPWPLGGRGAGEDEVDDVLRDVVVAT